MQMRVALAKRCTLFHREAEEKWKVMFPATTVTGSINKPRRRTAAPTAVTTRRCLGWGDVYLGRTLR